MTDIVFEEEILRFLELATTFNTEARYPDEKFAFARACTEEFTTLNYARIKEVYQWLISL